MAFMMPVVKNDWDIYKSNRSRRSSECSNGQSCRSRKVSECKSECPSLSTSPGSDFIVGSPAHRSVPMNMGHTGRGFSRTSSRTSQTSLQSPSKSIGSSPPKSGSTNSLNKFHSKLVDKLKKSLTKSDSSGNVGNSRSASWGWQNSSGRNATKLLQSESTPVNMSRRSNSYCTITSSSYPGSGAWSRT